MQCSTTLRIAAAMLLLSAVAVAAHDRDDDTGAQARFAEYGQPGVWLVQRDDGTRHAVLSNATPDDAHRPASSIKPLLALVALETGVLTGADEVLPWDGREYPGFPQWQTDMALDEAMRTSSESYFRTLALRIGRDTLAEWVARVEYGNGVIGAEAERAWHDGTLLVTPSQQLDFMDRLRRGALPFAPPHQAAVRAAMAEGHVGATAVFGKTGTHPGGAAGPGVGWFAGWTEGDGADAAFVLMLRLDGRDDRARRLQLARELLADSGLATAAAQ